MKISKPDSVRVKIFRLFLMNFSLFHIHKNCLSALKTVSKIWIGKKRSPAKAVRSVAVDISENSAIPNYENNFSKKILISRPVTQNRILNSISSGIKNKAFFRISKGCFFSGYLIPRKIPTVKTSQVSGIKIPRFKKSWIILTPHFSISERIWSNNFISKNFNSLDGWK